MEHTVEKFIPLGGKRCITNALKQIFYYHAHPMSEEMIFGIASGLAFTYINLANSPMVSGRTKPFEFESKLAERLNITIKCKQPKTYELAFTHTKKLPDKRFFRGEMLVGTMEVLEDAASKEMLWQEGDTMYHPLGVTDPDYCVIKFTATKGRVYSNFSSESFEIA